MRRFWANRHPRPTAHGLRRSDAQPVDRHRQRRLVRLPTSISVTLPGLVATSPPPRAAYTAALTHRAAAWPRPILATPNWQRDLAVSHRTLLAGGQARPDRRPHPNAVDPTVRDLASPPPAPRPDTRGKPLHRPTLTDRHVHYVEQNVTVSAAFAWWLADRGRT